MDFGCCRHQIAAKNEVEMLQVERRHLDLVLDRFPVLKGVRIYVVWKWVCWCTLVLQSRFSQNTTLFTIAWIFGSVVLFTVLTPYRCVLFGRILCVCLFCVRAPFCCWQCRAPKSGSIWEGTPGPSHSLSRHLFFVYLCRACGRGGWFMTIMRAYVVNLLLHDFVVWQRRDLTCAWCV